MLFLQTTNSTRSESQLLIPFIKGVQGTHDLIEKNESIPFYGNDKVKLFMMEFIKHALFHQFYE